MGEKFNLGQVVITAGADQLLSSEDVIDLLIKHSNLEPGLLCKEDQEVNQAALNGEDRILSAYEVRGQKFYVITEWDRSVTTILLPEEY